MKCTAPEAAAPFECVNLCRRAPSVSDKRDRLVRTQEVLPKAATANGSNEVWDKASTPDGDFKSWIQRLMDRQQALIQKHVEEQHQALRIFLDDRIAKLQEGAHAVCEETRPRLPDQESATRKLKQDGEPQVNRPASAEAALQGAPQAKKVADAVDSTINKPNSTTFAQGHLVSGTDSPKESSPTSCAGKLWRRVKAFERSGMFNGIVCFLVIANFIVIFLQLEFQGHLNGVALGYHSGDSNWNHAHVVFDWTEQVFNALFLSELALHCLVQGKSFFYNSTNTFDAVIVLTTSFDLYFLQEVFNVDGANLTMARLVRIFRVIKVMRVIRVAKYFAELRVILRTCAASCWALLWAVLLLSLLIISCGILMTQIVSMHITSVSDDLLVEWIYRHYGSSAKSSWTLFQATLSGCWPNYATNLIDGISHWFVMFWICYVFLVVFAVIRIIGALFLKETMNVASNDAEMMVMEKVKQKEAFAAKLKELFDAADTSGDGLISQEEFAEMMDNPAVQTYLQVLELEVYEVTCLFNLLDDGDGNIPFEEFLGGAMRLKGSARSVDAIEIMHEQHKIFRYVDAIATDVLQLLEVHRPGYASKIAANQLRIQSKSPRPDL